MNEKKCLERSVKRNTGIPGSGSIKKGLGLWAAIMSALLSLAFMAVQQHITTIFLVGDSTMADKAVATYPETGWGMPFRYYFDSTVKVDNRAQNGRSTRTFVQQGRWKSIMEVLKAGDYVLIQFGHNDEVPSKGSYTPPEQFVGYLAQFVRDARSKGAFPVLITPVARRRFAKSSSGKEEIQDTHKVYGNLVRKVARDMQVPLIDLQEKSMALLAQLGPENSTFLYNHLSPGENPHYPKGHTDDTHFNELGARKMAEIVLHGVQSLQLPLANHIASAK